MDPNSNTPFPNQPLPGRDTGQQSAPSPGGYGQFPQPGQQQPQTSPPAASYPEVSQPESPYAYQGQPYVAPSQPPVQSRYAATNTMPSVPPAPAGQPAMYASTTPQFASPAAQPGTNNLKKMILIPAIVVLIVLLGVGGWLALHKSAIPGKEVSVTIPDNWHTLDTKLGFTVKTPAKWEAGISSTSDFDGIKSKSTNLSPPISDSFDSSNTESVNVTAGVYSGTDKLDKAEFEQKVSNKKTYEQLYSLLGGDTSKLKLTTTRLNINGKEWLQVNFGITGSVFTTLYYWTGDHAIGVGVSDDGSSSNKSSAYQKYLLPIAASVGLTE